MTVKQKNKKKVLNCIRDHSPISRAEIAVKARISKPTVSMLVDDLIQEKLIFEKGIGESSSQGGRRPIQLYFNEKAFFIIGTDIGGTKVKTTICDLGGNIVASCSFKTVQYLKSGLLKQIAKEIDAMIDKNSIDRSKILGMGAGVPGITETNRGIVVEAPSLNWIRYPFIQEAKQFFTFPVYVDNDVNVAALGEQWLGNARNKRNVLFIAVGTGIGSGIIIHNQLYRGSTYAAGELGYMVTDKNEMKGDFTPVFHRYGYLESVAGGKAIGARLTKAVLEDPEHPLYAEAMESELPGEMAFKLAKTGDKTAMAVLAEAIQHLAYGIINAASLLNPEVIILGGGVLKSADLLLPKLTEIVNQYLPSSVELKISQLGDHAGALGAVSLFLREHETIFKI
ncbi:ROK family transcriptional regulator [Neobacillus notoginsengisoli]|uniref:ROK family transcriptional regulator n=2 Tax=Neobacillus notoginsengisoli TaxID=1578198 RepID=A0A417YZ30_9BACI|nr:ROK family transcriptional regulator [Neobacillus notoginsengisoli]